MSDEKKTERIVPNTQFDMEYRTMWKKEMLYLRQNNIDPVFILYTKEHHIPIYKYTKTPRLFELLHVFFSNKQNGDVNG